MSTIPSPIGDVELFRYNFIQLFEREPEVIGRGPGRVNLIGEHIDYLGGRVMPIAIDRAAHVAISRNQSNQIRLRASQYPADRFEVDIGAIERVINPIWVNYPLGVIHEFRKLRVALSGMDILIEGDVPAGSGLSSSAAVEVATAFALNLLTDNKLSPAELTRLAHRAETQFVGVPCGIMDQAASALGRKDHALLLDCATDELNPEYVPIGEEVAFVVAHSGKSRRLDESPYERRVEECKLALNEINSHVPNPYPHLCAVPPEVPDSIHAQLNLQGSPAPVWFRRAQHTIEEQQRVGQFAQAASRSDWSRAGEIMKASHASLRDLYEVSCHELDALVDWIRALPNVYGARLTGAGFGGCALALVRANAAEEIASKIADEFQRPRQIEPLAFACRAETGASAIRIA